VNSLIKLFLCTTAIAGASVAVSQAKLWQNIVPVTDTQLDFTRSAAIAQDGTSVYLGSGDDPSVLKVDAAGNFLWRYEEPPVPGRRIIYRSFTLAIGGDVFVVGDVMGSDPHGFAMRLSGLTGGLLWRTRVIAVDTQVFMGRCFVRPDGVLMSTAVHGGAQEIRSFTGGSGAQRRVVNVPYSLSLAQMMPNGDLITKSGPTSIARIRAQSTVILWDRELPSEGEGTRQIKSIVICKNGELFVAGSRVRGTEFRPEIARINSVDGSEMWSYFSPADSSAPIVQSSDSGEILSAYATSGTPRAIKVARLAPGSGKPMWNATLTAPGPELVFQPSGIAVGSEGRLFVSAIYGGAEGFSIRRLSVAGLSTTTGQVAFNKVTGPSYFTDERPMAQAVGPDGNLLVAGSVRNSNAVAPALWSIRATNGARAFQKNFAHRGPAPAWVADASDAGAIFTASRSFFSWVLQSVDYTGATRWQTVMRRTALSLNTLTPPDIRSVATFRSMWGGPAEMYVLGNLEAIGELVAVDGDTGAIRWRRPMAELNPSRICVAGSDPNLFVMAYEPATGLPQLLCLSRNDGSTLWSRTLTEYPGLWGADMKATSDGHLLISNADVTVKIDAINGATIWSVEGGANKVCLSSDAVYLTGSVGDVSVLRKLSLATGATIWSRPSEAGTVFSNLISVRGNFLVVLRNVDGLLVASRRNVSDGLETASMEIAPIDGMLSAYRDLQVDSKGNAYVVGTASTATGDFLNETAIGVTWRLDFLHPEASWSRVVRGVDYTHSSSDKVFVDLKDNAIVVGLLGKPGADGLASSLVTTSYAK
jgi:hypothetical protein